MKDFPYLANKSQQNHAIDEIRYGLVFFLKVFTGLSKVAIMMAAERAMPLKS